MLSNPEQWRNTAIANLPKDCSGDKNGNWKGGITALSRGIRWSREYRQWRASVVKRDGGKCKLCGSTHKLHVHHIVAMSQCRIIAALRMNGVLLCKQCHYQNDEAWQGKRFPQFVGVDSKVLIFTIPHKFQEYETVGNWQFTKDGTIVIFVSRLSDWRREMLIAIHELVEVSMCKQEGITATDVDKFDKDFEQHRHPDDESEPGDDPMAPYVREHCVATGIERILAALLGVSWKEYGEELDSLS